MSEQQPTAAEIRETQSRIHIILLINLLIAVVGPSLLTIFGGFWDYLLSAIAGVIVLSIFERQYATYLLWSTVFVAYLGWQIILSNISLAWLVLQPKPQLDPGIIAIPLSVRTGLEITTLATAITLTPGTLSVDLGRDHDGDLVLYVHSLRVGDPEQFRTQVKDGFERMIMRISRG